jgi:hypothetical protein
LKRPKGPASRKERRWRFSLGDHSWLFLSRPFIGVLPPELLPVCWPCTCDACGQVEERVYKVKKPVVDTVNGNDALCRVEPPKMLAKLPNVAEILAQPIWEDGDPKGDRALFCFISTTLVKLLLKLESAGVKLMVQGRSWDEAWAALEAVLRAEKVPWEADVQNGSQRPKKKR